ncbi:hypothetical protein D3C77_396170 [compost metagenome]
MHPRVGCINKENLCRDTWALSSCALMALEFLEFLCFGVTWAPVLSGSGALEL